MTLTEALDMIRPLAGQQYVSIDVEVTDHPERRTDKRTVEYTIYVAGTGSEPAWAHESASTLEDAVACIVARLRPASDSSIVQADAVIAGLTDPRR